MFGPLINIDEDLIGQVGCLRLIILGQNCYLHIQKRFCRDVSVLKVLRHLRICVFYHENVCECWMIHSEICDQNTHTHYSIFVTQVSLGYHVKDGLRSTQKSFIKVFNSKDLVSPKIKIQLAENTSRKTNHERVCSANLSFTYWWRADS